MSEPTIKELFDYIRKVDAKVTAIAAELKQQKAEIAGIIASTNREFETASAVVRDHERRVDEIERTLRQHQDLDGAILEHDDRLRSVEKKLFPRLWPTIWNAESIIGGLDDRFDLHHPLDQRSEKP